MTLPNLSVLRDLKARVEGAEGRDRELDAYLTAALEGGEIVWKQANYTMDQYPTLRRPSRVHLGGFSNDPVPELTASTDAAIGLIHRALPRFDWYVNRDGGHVADVVYFADVWNGAERERRIDIMHNTPTLALLSGLLSALIAKAERSSAIDTMVEIRQELDLP